MGRKISTSPQKIQLSLPFINTNMIENNSAFYLAKGKYLPKINLFHRTWVNFLSLNMAHQYKKIPFCIHKN